jgi:putative ABC transport system ATP-binding protein
MPDCAPILEVTSLEKRIHSGTHEVLILRGLSFSVPRGQFVAIRGPSGSGKSTLLGLLAGLDSPSAGEVRIDGEAISGLSEDRMAVLRARKIGFVFQSYQLVPTLTAEENVLLPLDLIGEGEAGAERARRLLDEVGLPDRRDHYPVQLSGGEQQRVALARAFISSPPLILADEPTGNLDTANGEHVLEMLKDLNRRAGATLVLVTHDLHLAQQADRIITLRDGLIVSDLLTANAAEEPALTSSSGAD